MSDDKQTKRFHDYTDYQLGQLDHKQVEALITHERELISREVRDSMQARVKRIRYALELADERKNFRQKYLKMADGNFAIAARFYQADHAWESHQQRNKDVIGSLEFFNKAFIL